MHRPYPAAIVLSTICLAITPPGHAAAIQLLSSTDLSPTSATATYPGASGTTLLSPLLITTPDNTVTLLAPGPIAVFRRFDQGSGFTADFVRGTPLLNPQSARTLDITFSVGLSEVGLQAQSGYVRSFASETLTAYNGSTSLGSWTVSAVNTGSSSGNAPFLGARATGGDSITRIQVSNSVGGSELDYYFAIGPVRYLNAAVQPVPEPATWLLLSLSLAGLAAWRGRPA